MACSVSAVRGAVELLLAEDCRKRCSDPLNSIGRQTRGDLGYGLHHIELIFRSSPAVEFASQLLEALRAPT